MSDDTVILRGRDLTIDDVARVARGGAKVSITTDGRVEQKVRGSQEYVTRLVAAGERLYGVTTGFGGQSNVAVSAENACDLQEALLWFLKSGAGARLPIADVRASMLLRANSLLCGVSGIRMDLIRRFETFLNNGVTPHVRELGSIGASGDLVPLAAIAGAVIGLDNSFTVDFKGKEMSSIEALRLLGLEPVRLEPKEGLALVNGSSVMTAIAMNAVFDSRVLFALAMGAHALMFQALRGNTHALHPFIHHHKPHPGQVWVARNLFKLLKGSKWTYGEKRGGFEHSAGSLAQDRYSLRCIPQYMGPIVDGLAVIARQMEVEANSATDNPLFDGEGEAYYEGGNFLGQYIGIGMDQLRQYIALTAKHLDTQIAMLVAPEFNNGLPGSLVGNEARPVNMGLKGLQLTGNSIVPELLHLGTPMSDRYLTHAEQFNQNINSLGFGSANLARRAVAFSQQYMAVALMFGVQAADLRARREEGHYDGRAGLSPATVPLYEAVYKMCRVKPGRDRAFVHDDRDQSLESYIEEIAADIARVGTIPNAVQETMQALREPGVALSLRQEDHLDMNVAQNIIRGRKLFPRKVALTFENRHYTYTDLDEWSNRVAEGLAASGVGRGDRVALFLPNIPEFAVAYLGIQKLGAVAVSLNSTLRSEETRFILNDSGAVALFTTEALRGNVDHPLKHVIIVEGAAPDGDRTLAQLTANTTGDFTPAIMDRDDPSAILYTSGTTGEPKGACLSHGNVISNMYAFNYNCGMRPDDKLLLFLPLFHCFGQNAILNSGFNACATVVLHRTFHPATIVRSLADDEVTMFFGVPTTFIPLYNLASAAEMEAVRYYFSAAATLPREIARKWEEKYKRPINEGYGLTETSPFASYNHRLWYKLGSIGAPIENVEMRTVDPETGAEVPTGDPGEIVIRGPNVMLGYWNRPEATAKAIRNGWFHTGDIGRVDEDGYFYIVDRLKDMVNVGGLKVYPVEVENTIYLHPAVEEVAVYGIPDKFMGERVCANIVRKKGYSATEAEIIAFCRQQLADYKIPGAILFVEAIPKSPTGKILKRVLRDEGRHAIPAAAARSAGPIEIEMWVREWLTDNLEVDGGTVAADRSFFEYGMTSLTGLKLSAQLGEWLGRPMEDVLVWNHGTLEALVRYAAEPANEIAAKKNGGTGDVIDDLTADEVAQLLEAELGTE
ncbi:MAG: aromatic amino acid lyase [Thermoanaerobaculia bacterium]